MHVHTCVDTTQVHKLTNTVNCHQSNLGSNHYLVQREELAQHYSQLPWQENSG